jgi:hypothetical protein
MRVLIGCESSGKTREAFRRRGHEAWSCDLLPSADNSPWHFQQDIRHVLHCMRGYFDLFIVHPTCTFLCNSGVKHLYIDGRKENGPYLPRWQKMREAAEFFKEMLNADIPRVVAENPIMHGHAQAIIGCGPSQIIQPWQFGHPEFKATCLWIRGVPLLQPTKILVPPAVGTQEHKVWSRVHRMPPGADRWQKRSETLQGHSDAYAEQWGMAA